MNQIDGCALEATYDCVAACPGASYPYRDYDGTEEAGDSYFGSQNNVPLTGTRSAEATTAMISYSRNSRTGAAPTAITDYGYPSTSTLKSSSFSSTSAEVSSTSCLSQDCPSATGNSNSIKPPHSAATSSLVSTKEFCVVVFGVFLFALGFTVNGMF
jgi:hypothetical protein